MRAKLQLKVVRSIAKQLNEELRKIQYETIEMLGIKLKVAIDIIEATIKSDGAAGQKVIVNRWKYALTQQKIDRTIEDLKEWQQLFDPSWYLIMKGVDVQVDLELKMRRESVVGLQDPISSARSLRHALNPPSSANVPSLSLKEAVLESLNLRDIPFCSAQLGSRPDTKESLIVERINPLPGVNINDLHRDARDLARRLSHADALEFRLLSCKGYVHHHRMNPSRVQPDTFTMIFRAPAGYSQPRTLRRYLLEMRYTDSLSERFKLANDLARAVSYVHTFGFVHKNVRPETILLLKNDESSIRSAFLIGFDSFRMASGKTLRKGEAAWERCLYQHPQRIGSSPSEDYVMHHDIYSLGVCLLEIGLWESFVSYENNDIPLASDGNAPKQVRGSILEPDIAPILFQEQLLLLARGELRRRMGTKYSEIVVTCLTCLDPGNIDFGDESEFKDQDGIVVGVRYIEKVCF
jgi:hypothetical protein